MKTTKKTVITGLVAAMFLVLAVTGMAMANDTITGTVAAKGEIIILDAADSSYVLEGSDQAMEMVGKKVTVTGTVAEKEDIKVINVVTIEEVKE